jgi:hypothetical protein
VNLYNNTNFKYSQDDYNAVIDELKKYNIKKHFDITSITDNDEFNIDSCDYITVECDELVDNINSVCSNVYIAVNVLVDYFYKGMPNSNKTMLWKLYGKYICKNVKLNTVGKSYFPFPDNEGTISYLGKKYTMKEVECV